MGFNPEIHHRHSIRLKEYDYSQNGYYFITICTENRECRFGEIVKKCWFDLPNHYTNCILDVYIIMPNHFHGIVVIDNGNEIITNTSSKTKTI